MSQDILHYRIKRNNKYGLLETVQLLSDDNLLIEGSSFIGSKIHRAMTVAIMSLLDDATGELSGLIAVLPLLYKNVYEIHVSNRKVEELLMTSATSPESKKLLSEVRKELISDISDIVNAIVIALPIPIIDTAGIALFNMIENLIIGKGAVSVTDNLDDFSQNNPVLSNILKILAYPFGGNVIYTGLKNIEAINGKQSQIKKREEEIAMRSNEIYSDFFVDEIDLEKEKVNNLTELKIKTCRWQVLSGIN